LADDKETLILEEELAEMKEQLEIFVKQKVDSIFPSIDYKILPISSEDSYIYRVYSRNTKLDLDIKYINKFGQNEYGKTRWNRLSELAKKKEMNKLLERINIEETLKITGFNGFKDTLNGYLSKENQKIFVNNHLSQGIQLITGNTKIDISDDIQKFYDYYLKYKDLSKRIKVGINTNEIFNQFITNYLKSWITNILKTFIHQKDNSNVVVFDERDDNFQWKLIQDSYLPQIKEAKEIIDKAKCLFNGDIPIINKLEYIITSSINNHYVDDINSKTKSVSDLFGHFISLIKNKFTITKELIGNFFSNEDMINKPANEIIEYINKLETECSLSVEDKREKVLDILKKIYLHIGSKLQILSNICETDGYVGNFNYLEGKYIPSYLYYSNLFWNKYIMFNDNYDGKIDELNYLTITNIKGYGNNTHKIFYEKKDELCVLEKYYVSLLEDPNTIKKFNFKNKKKLVAQNELNVTSDSDDDVPHLPKGWETHVSKSCGGQTYYVNLESKISQWDFPTGTSVGPNKRNDMTVDDVDGSSDALYDNDGNLSDDLDKALGI
jgi:hypothetical protein